MMPLPATQSWLASSATPAEVAQNQRPGEFERLWRGFMTARATLGLVLVVLQGGIFFLSPAQSRTPLLICAAYFTTALVVRLKTRPQQLGNTFDAQWLRTVGVDVMAFAALQMLQGSSLNYAPLFALPVLMVSVLGSMMLAMGAAAGITLLLFAYAGWLTALAPLEGNAHFLQAALTGTGCFAISFIASQMATRLASVERQAQDNHLAVAVQRQVNELVIESLTDGVLVVDEHGQVLSANPSARQLMDIDNTPSAASLNLRLRPGWQAMLNLILQSFAIQSHQQADISVHNEGRGVRYLRVRTQLASQPPSESQRLCVVFIQDQREVQARIRTEKLASMGRMSAAVAHEIRNPLAAIAQANALLTEDLSDPGQLRLAAMVQQNAHRLEKIVNDVLHLAQAPATDDASNDELPLLNLSETARRICRDWKNQHAVGDELLLSLPPGSTHVVFDAEHLRRILINLLDNALRYASHQTACIEVSVDDTQACTSKAEAEISVWSDGAPLEPAVEQHLFEPFFSSESRSSGLGLYICRELCESHGAVMSYDRSQRSINGVTQPGNQFRVVFKTRSLQSTIVKPAATEVHATQ